MKQIHTFNMKKRLVIIIDSIFPSVSGGKENWLYEMSKQLQKEYDISIISQKTKTKPFYPIDKLDRKSVV